MSKRAVDLSLEELTALGANAALLAAQKALAAGLTTTGTVDFYENGQAISSLAQRHASGAVTLTETLRDKPASETVQATHVPASRS